MCEDMRKQITALFSVVMLVNFVLAGELTYGQKIDRCKLRRDERTPKIQVKRAERIRNASTTLALYTVVKPPHFNSEDMSAMGQRLNKEYCNEKKLTVLIFDDPRPIKDFVPVFDLRVEQPVVELRGFYILDRITGREVISFNTERGGPRTEVDLTKLNHSLN